MKNNARNNQMIKRINRKISKATVVRCKELLKYKSLVSYDGQLRLENGEWKEILFEAE